jgi:hypothetical protein
MEKRNLGKKASAFVWLCLLVMIAASGAFAWGGRHGGFSHGYHGYYGYHGWGYWPYWDAGYSIITPPIGAVVGYLPDGYSTFVVGGIPYYYFDGYYFRSCPSGYVVVEAPSVPSVSAQEPAAKNQPTEVPNQASSSASKQQSGSTVSGTQESKAPSGAIASSSGDALTVNIPNTNGGFTTVKLTKVKDGYKGPQGEFYPNHPTVDELRVLYGK